MTSKNNDLNNSVDPLNVTIPRDIKPIAFSTELKVKRKSRLFPEKLVQNESVEIPIDFTFAKDRSCSIIANENEEGSRLSATAVPIKNNEEEDGFNISYRYLIKHKQPEYPQVNLISESHPNEEKTPFRESNIVQPNSNDLLYFQRCSNTIPSLGFLMPKRMHPFENDLRSGPNRETFLLDSDSNEGFDENNDTVYMMKQIKDLDLNDTTVSGIDDVLGDVTLQGSLNMTQLATNLQLSEKKKAEQRLCVDNDIIILSNKASILWVGIPVQVSDIKSFTLNLKSKFSENVSIRIKRSNSCFFITNQLGQDRAHESVIKFAPNTTKKLYVSFHPTNSNYHSDVIIINVGERKFKIGLFGYAEPSIVELRGFSISQDPYDESKLILKKTYPKYLGEKTITMSVFNSGARTAFVEFFSQNINVKFHPRMFLLIPKTRTEFDLNVTVTDNMKVLEFVMVSVDEELRRAARINFAELPEDQQFKVCNSLQIFNHLPEEKTIRQDDLPKFDYRPHLCRQINTLSRYCYLHFDSEDYQSAATSDRWGNESASTIGMFTKSSMTAPSHMSNIEQIYRKSLGAESAVSFVNNLNNTLSAVNILNDVNIFSLTPVLQSNYIGVLIRNNHKFCVEWLMSDLLASYHDSLLGGHVSKINRSPSPDTSSIYSLTSIPIYNTANTMDILIKSGSLQPNASVVVPVRFTPVNTGKTECHCRVRVFSHIDDVTFEKELEFIGDAVRLESVCGLPEGGVPYFVVDRIVEREVRARDLGKEAKMNLSVHMKYKGRHGLLLFVSQPRPPFELKVPSVYLTESRSMLSVVVRGASCVAGTSYRDVIVFVDQDGNSTFTDLVVRVT